MLDDRDRAQSWGVAAQFVHESPRRVGVEEVEVGQRRARVLVHAVPPRRGTRFTVACAGLVRVLAVTSDRRALEREVQCLGHDLVDVTRRCTDLTTLVEPANDLGVVARGVGERRTRESVARRVRQRTVRLQFFEDLVVLRGARKYCDVLVILRGAAHHGRTADIDEFDRRVRRERVEVAHHDVDGRDVVSAERRHVFGFRAVREDAAVNPRMQRLDASI